MYISYGIINYFTFLRRFISVNVQQECTQQVLKEFWINGLVYLFYFIATSVTIQDWRKKVVVLVGLIEYYAFMMF